MVIGAHDSMITMENGGNAIYGATCGVMNYGHIISCNNARDVR